MKVQADKTLAVELLKVFIFAAAFGYIEAACAHYLRVIFYPGGFDTTVNLAAMTDKNILLVELGREAATLVLLGAAAALTRGPFIRRFSNFVFAFAVWDIVYYIGLYAFERWPKNIMDWDVLFLIPVPWFAPVLSPVLISLLGIAGALIVQVLHEKMGDFRAGALPLLLITAGLVMFLITFIHGVRTIFPSTYNWPLFAAGCAAVIAAYVMFIRNGLKAQRV